MPEFAADGALFVPPKDAEAFAAAAQRAMTDPGLRARARTRADSFRWSDSVDRLVDVWRRASEETH
jgi:glycosyltransferase involved in cell wall biosynthesis